MNQNGICLFSSYFNGNTLPYYVEYYVNELSRHFSKILFITNTKGEGAWKDVLNRAGIEVMEVENEGYDFGMWYKAILKMDLSTYREIALVNDSCILFRPIDEDIAAVRAMKEEYVGMVLSDRYSPHLQSYFIMAKGKAVPTMLSYFLDHGIVNEYREVIQTYEIGLSVHMTQTNIGLGTLYNKGFSSFPKNPSFARIEALIHEGIPMIKKKIIYRNFRGLEYYWVIRMNFSTRYKKYVRIIQEKYSGKSIIDFDRVMLDAPRKGSADIWLMETGRFIANAVRLIPGATWLFRRSVQVFKSIKNKNK
jgi:lipopolysaccharide biosynthesis protein